MRLWNNFKFFFSNLWSKFKSQTLNSLLIDQSIDEKCLDLEKVIKPEFAVEKFNRFLTLNGLNPLSISFAKLWSNCLFLTFLIGFIKTLLTLFLDPITDHDLCVYLGDISLLFESLREFMLIMMILTISFALFTNHLFDHNRKTEWLELLKCLEGKITPSSIGIRDKKIVIKMLILTKIGCQLVKIIVFSFTLIAFIFCLYSLFVNPIVRDNLGLMLVVWWIPATAFAFYFIAGTLFASDLCFYLITYYCFINVKCFNQLINNLKIELSSGYKKFIVKLKIKSLIKNQKQFSIRILKYNEFWSEFYFILMLHILPSNVICIQQILFGDINFQLRIIYIICWPFGISFILLSSFSVCLLAKEMKVHHKKLIQLQVNPHFKMDVMTKLKVKSDYAM